MSAGWTWQVNDSKVDLTLTAIKGRSELLLALGHPLMNDMKQLWDSNRGTAATAEEEWWRVDDSSPHTALTCAQHSHHAKWTHTLMVSSNCWWAWQVGCQKKNATTSNHSTSGDILSKGCFQHFCINYCQLHGLISKGDPLYACIPNSSINYSHIIRVTIKMEKHLLPLLASKPENCLTKKGSRMDLCILNKNK